MDKIEVHYTGGHLHTMTIRLLVVYLTGKERL